ncbi:MAG: hypothetical protein J6J83_02395 [Oscillospiraceae bacterium]|nr:hypothetical protein [Oscillospiraceae bacterium]
MFEIRVVVDEVDYHKLADFLLPIIADSLEAKGGVLSILAKNRNSLSVFVKQTLDSMSQEKKNEFLLQLFSEKKGLALTKINEKAAKENLGVKLLDINVKQI